MKVSVICLCLIPLLFSCSTLQQKSWLDEHQSQLNLAAQDTEDPRAQMDVLLTSLIDMMNESLEFGNPKKGLKFVQNYKDQNEASIQKIMKNLELWMSDKEPMDQIATGLSLLSDSNVQQFLALIPKFERKYKQIQFFSNLVGKLKGIFR